MDPRQFQLDMIIVDHEQPPSFTVGDRDRGLPGQVDANGINQTAWFDRFHEQGRKSIGVGLRLFETAEESGQRENRQLIAAWKCTQAAEELESIHVRKNEI